MYQALLTRRYLTSKIMPLLAALAVMLCVFLVLVTWSVMGGFLQTLLSSGRTFVGDVKVMWPTVGFAHYDDLIKRLNQDPAVGGATSIIETFGLIGFDDSRLEGVNILGIDPATYGSVAEFQNALWWKPLAEPLRKDKLKGDPRLDPSKRAELERFYQEGLSLSEPDPITGEPRPAAVLGIEVAKFSIRHLEGFYTPRISGQATPSGEVRNREDYAPNTSVTISVLPLDKKGRSIDVSSRRFPVANEFRTGIYEIDRRTIFLPLPALQRMLKMDAAERLAPGGSPGTLDFSGPPGGESFGQLRTAGIDPARVTSVWVKAAPGVTPDQLRARVVPIYEQFATDHLGEVPSVDLMRANPHLIATWEETNAVLVGAVKKETITVIMLIIICSVFASALILAIFWSMVAEKTRDVGVLRALGASGPGIAWIWLRYGLAIGVIGAILGGLAAWGVVHNINEIHEWMGRALGVQVWDPKVYYFTDIPNKINPGHAAIVLAGGVFLSVLGALIPAIHAARMEPVRALRFE